MEWAAFGLALIALIVSLIPYLKRGEQKNVPDFFLPPKASTSKKAKKPTVRDEIAGWRQEQEERYEWESELRKKGVDL